MGVSSVFGCEAILGIRETTNELPEAAVDAASDDVLDVAEPDATPSVDAGRTCDATFCDDFDEGDIGAKWSHAQILGGQLSFDTTLFQSPPRSLRSELREVSDGGSKRAMLVEDLPPARGVRCAFSINVQELTTPVSSNVTAFNFYATADSVNSYSLLFAVETDRTTLREDVQYLDGGCGCPRKQVSLPSIALGGWSRVVLDTDFATATVIIDGALVYQGDFGGIVPTSVSVTLGAQAKISPIDLRFDDFECTVR